VCIVMDKFNGGDLVDGLQLHLKERGKIPCHSLAHVSQQMIVAIEFLHSKSVVHRDIKGDNYLMDRMNITDPGCHIVLTDFGTACHLQESQRLSEEVGTRIFWAPEIFNKDYGLKVDVWALGVIMYGLLEGRFPFKDGEAVRTQEPKRPKRIEVKCEHYLKLLLSKEESARPTAAEASVHPWLLEGSVPGASVPGSAGSFDGGKDREHLQHERLSLGSMSGEEVSMTRVDCADHGVHERRQELVARLNYAHTKAKTGKKGLHQESLRTLTEHRHFQASTRRFAWYRRDEAAAMGVLAPEGKMVAEGDTLWELDRSPEFVGQLLQDNNIDIAKFGVGAAKSLDHLAAEVQSGSARLMLDASEHKKLVRVVDVVLLRLFEASSGRILIETAEQYPDGRVRKIPRLPGTKREPYENTRDTAERIFKDLLGMGGCSVHFNFDGTEVFEEENDSPSFPGVRTVYRKEIVQVYVACSDASALAALGLPHGDPWKAEDSKHYIKHFEWMTEQQAISTQVKLRAEGSEEVSGLVMAPIGLKEEDLRTFLASRDIDVSLFGTQTTKSIKEFSSDLIKGESSLLTKNNKVLRVVDVVLLQIVNLTTGKVLVQMDNGHSGPVGCLPGAKRRPDENQFLTARRILRRHLNIDENEVRIDRRSCKYFEEERSSPGLPDAIQTVYRRRIITVEFDEAWMMDNQRRCEVPAVY